MPDVVPATAVPATEAPTAAAPAATAAPQQGVNSDIFTNITQSGDAFSLKCSPSELTFSASSSNAYLTKTQFYYRMVDKQNNISSPWSMGGEMKGDGNGNYSLTFTALNVNPDLRYDHGWFEYQLIGLSKTGSVVGRTQKIEKQVTFTLNCP